MDYETSKKDLKTISVFSQDYQLQNFNNKNKTQAH